LMPAESLLDQGDQLFSRADFDEAERAYHKTLDLFREVCPPSTEAPMRIEKTQLRLRQIRAIRRDSWEW
jgi:hypothetical protein